MHLLKIEYISGNIPVMLDKYYLMLYLVLNEKLIWPWRGDKKSISEMLDCRILIKGKGQRKNKLHNNVKR